MSELSTIAVAVPDLAVRPLAWRDLHRVELLARRAGPLPWSDRELPAILEAADTIGCVAEGRDGFAGFVVGAAARPPGMAPPPAAVRLAHLVCRAVFRATAPPRIDRVGIAVAPEYPADVVEPALLRRFVRELGRSAGCTEVVVSETNLTVQLLLRDAGFRAIRVLHGHYDAEDGYLLVRPTGPIRFG